MVFQVSGVFYSGSYMGFVIFGGVIEVGICHTCVIFYMYISTKRGNVCCSSILNTSNFCCCWCRTSMLVVLSRIEERRLSSFRERSNKLRGCYLRKRRFALLCTWTKRGMVMS